MSLDGSIVDLSVSVFDWAHYRSTKGAIKLHLPLDHDGYLPSFAAVTDGKRSELEVAWDGGYFVTRMKTNTVYSVVEECEVPAKSNVLRNQIVFLPSLERDGREPVLFRRIEYWNPDKQEILVFFTNLLHLAALLRQQLFIFIDLWAWLNNPMEGPPAATAERVVPIPLVW